MYFISAQLTRGEVEVKEYNSFTEAIKDKKMLPIVFPKQLTDNYIKIISNIFLLNLRKIQLSMLEEFEEVLESTEPDELVKFYNVQFEKNYNATR